MDMSIEQALCRALSADTWDATAIKILSEGYDTEEYEDPAIFIEDYCEGVGVEYDPYIVEPLCSCDGCQWFKECGIKQ